MHVRRIAATAIMLAALALVGCGGADGATGPMGPPGPQGPQGPPGPAGASGAVNRFVLEGQFGSSGTVVGGLPAAAVTNGGLPAIACYVSSDRRTWLQVAQTPSSSTMPYCGLTGIGTSTPGITLVNGTPGWYYYLVAVY